MKALKELRRSLGDDATYAVSKNTLTTIAAREAGVEGIEEHLVGPTAIAFIEGDPVVVAKGLRDFARTNPLLVIKGGVLDGKVTRLPTRSTSWPTWSRVRCCWPRSPVACRASCSRPSRWSPHRCPRPPACSRRWRRRPAENPSLLAAAAAACWRSRPTPTWPRRGRRRSRRNAETGGRREDDRPSEPSNEELPLRRHRSTRCTRRRRRRGHHASIRCGRQLGRNANHGEAQHCRAP